MSDAMKALERVNCFLQRNADMPGTDAIVEPEPFDGETLRLSDIRALRQMLSVQQTADEAHSGERTGLEEALEMVLASAEFRPGSRPEYNRPLNLAIGRVRKWMADCREPATLAQTAAQPEEEQEGQLRDAYCWGYRQACEDNRTRPRAGDLRQKEAEAAWEKDRPHLTNDPNVATISEVQERRIEGLACRSDGQFWDFWEGSSTDRSGAFVATLILHTGEQK